MGKSVRLYDMFMKDPDIEPGYKEDLEGIPIIDCTNVSQIYYVENDKENWSLEDFPNVAPIAPTFWMDFTAPDKMVSEVHGTIPWDTSSQGSHWGFLVHGNDLRHEEERDYFKKLMPAEALEQELWLNQARWGLEMWLHMRVDEKVYGPAWYWRILISEEGEILHNSENKPICLSMPVGIMAQEVDAMMQLSNIDEIKAKKILAYIKTMKDFQASRIVQVHWEMSQSDALEFTRKLKGMSEAEAIKTMKDSKQMDREEALMATAQRISPFWECALLSLSFMHCKNVTLDLVTPPLQRVHNKSAKRRGEKDFQPVRYHVLNVKPMKEVLRREGGSEKNGTQKAMHLCRGHFKDYKNGRGLFGKHKGMYYFSQQIRGSHEEGIVTKDYKITP